MQNFFCMCLCRKPERFAPKMSLGLAPSAICNLKNVQNAFQRVIETRVHLPESFAWPFVSQVCPFGARLEPGLSPGFVQLSPSFYKVVIQKSRYLVFLLGCNLG